MLLYCLPQVVSGRSDGIDVVVEHDSRFLVRQHLSVMPFLESLLRHGVVASLAVGALTRRLTHWYLRHDTSYRLSSHLLRGADKLRKGCGDSHICDLLGIPGAIRVPLKPGLVWSKRDGCLHPPKCQSDGFRAFATCPN